jgi:hypothetical protein
MIIMKRPKASLVSLSFFTPRDYVADYIKGFKGCFKEVMAEMVKILYPFLI